MLERVERQAMADRQALFTAAAINGVEKYTPLDLDEQLAAFDRWLESDPTETPEARAQRRDRELMQEVA